jgi:hypothetical protein
VSLVDQRDLDNFLLPTAHRPRASGRLIVSVHGSKAHAPDSFVAVDHASPAMGASPKILRTVELTGSHDVLSTNSPYATPEPGVSPLPEGPVRRELVLGVGPDRNWLPTLETTIGALQALLGHDPGAEQRNARDGPITQLALPCDTDLNRKWEVGIAISAAPSVVTRAH